MTIKPKYHKGLTRREILRYGLLSGLSAVLPPTLWLSGCRKQASKKQPDIFLITVDTLRADHLGCYGYHRNTSPNIDEFAQDAMLFENCLSHAPDTRLSFASILSGFYPHETKITENLYLPSGVDTIAKILHRRGYKTMSVISNYVLRRGRGWEQGFEIYNDTMNELESVRRWPERTAGPTTNRAIELIKQFHNIPKFMWIHYQDPHGPYTPPLRFAEIFEDEKQASQNIKLNKSLSGRGGIPSYQRLGSSRNFHHYVSQYDSEIRYQDEQFSILVDALKDLNIYDNALIIFTSDHGEGMGEHDYFFAHGEYLYNHQTHVPLIIKYRDELCGRRKDFVQHIDIVPTVLNVLGIKPESRFRGCDLRKRDKTKKDIFAEMKSPLVQDGVKFSLVRDENKLIYTPLFNQYELFKTKNDHNEKNNLINDQRYKTLFEDLKIQLNRIAQEDFLRIGQVKKPEKLTKEEIEKLKSLGYVQ